MKLEFGCSVIFGRDWTEGNIGVSKLSLANIDLRLFVLEEAPIECWESKFDILECSMKSAMKRSVNGSSSGCGLSVESARGLKA
jgi:hypothetical protein